MRATMTLQRSFFAISLLALAPTSLAQDAGTGTSNEELLRRLDQLEKRNAALETEVTQLKQADGDEWLTEQRAAEIRSIVADTLADADTRWSLQGSGATAGWDDGFFLASPDGRFRMNVHGLLQTRFIWNWMRTTPPSSETSAAGQPIVLPAYTAYDWTTSDANEEGFDIPEAQLWIDGHLFGPGVRYMLRGNFENTQSTEVSTGNVRPSDSGSGQFTLLDAWTRFDLDSQWSFRAGQFRLPFSREELVDWQYQLATQRSVISYSMGVWYSQGIELGYADDFFRAQFAFSNGGQDNIGGQLKLNGGSDGLNQDWLDGDGSWAFTGRMEFKPYGSWEQFKQFTSPGSNPFGMLFGFGINYQETQADFGTAPSNPAQQGTNNRFDLTVDASFDFGGLSVFAAGYYSYNESHATYVQGGGDPSAGNPFPPLGVPTYFDTGSWTKWGVVLQSGFYIDPKVELFARYELGSFSSPDNESIRALTTSTTPNFGALYGFENNLSIVNVGVNWYIDGQDIRWTTQLGYSLDSVDPSWYNEETGWRVTGSRDALVFQSQLQLLF